MRLKGKIAIVTGGGAGIGAACAIRYAQEGASVVIVDLNPDTAEATAATISEGGGKSLIFIGDMGETSVIDEMIAKTLETFGRIDILHNNTAWAPVGTVTDASTEDWYKSIDVSVTAYWYASKLALPKMVDQGGGVILNTASISGLYADYGLGIYNIAKSAVINLTRTIAIDYARKGIRCNALCPGLVWTTPYEQMAAAGATFMDDMAEGIPMGRFAQTDEIANIATFMVSDEASFVTGSTWIADGGQTAHSGTIIPSDIEAS